MDARRRRLPLQRQLLLHLLKAYVMHDDIIGHWYLRDMGGPFRNFLNGTPAEQEVVARQLKEKYDRGYFHREYIDGRDKVERELYRLFVARGGMPEVDRPIYCFLGNHPTELIYGKRQDYAFKFFRLEDIPSEIISFTYPGSIASLQIAEQERAKEFRSPYHGKLYRKEVIHGVIAQYGMPGIDFIPAGSRRYDVLVEAQIWSVTLFDRLEEVTGVNVSWLPWIANPSEERQGLKKD